jgi:hypothetical protein
MAYGEGYSFVANGDIYPARFVIPDASNKGRVIAANGTNLTPIGISGIGTNHVPYGDLDSNLAAAANQTLRVHGPGEMRVKLTLDANCTYGDFLGPVSGGNGTPVTANESVYGAIALETGLAGQMIEVEVRPGVRRTG